MLYILDNALNSKILLYILDNACLEWGSRCGSRTHCLLYDTDVMRTTLFYMVSRCMSPFTLLSLLETFKISFILARAVSYIVIYITLFTRSVFIDDYFVIIAIIGSHHHQSLSFTALINIITKRNFITVTSLLSYLLHMFLRSINDDQD